MFDFFVSDWHLFHGAIIKYCNRPYKSVEKMHRDLIARNNAVVSPTDHLWVLGDVSLRGPGFVGQVKNVVEKFNGIKHLVLGNHDDWRMRNYLSAGFLTVHSAMWFHHQDLTFYMMHDPAEYTAIQNDSKAFQLCGHIHQLFDNLLPEKRIINVGVDVNDMFPTSLSRIMEVIKNARDKDQ